MSFPVDTVIDHIRTQTDLLAESWEHAANREIAITADGVDFVTEKPAFTAYGVAVWLVSGSTTLSLLIPSAIVPTEWDGVAFAPPDLAERLVNAILPESVDYRSTRLATVGEVVGAYATATKVLAIPFEEGDHPILLFIGLENPAAVHRVGSNRLASFPVQVVVTLAEKKIDMAQMLAMGVGTMISFEKPAEDFLDLYVNNHLHARGEAVKIGENFGLRVNQIGVEDARVSPVIPPMRKVVVS